MSAVLVFIGPIHYSDNTLNPLTYSQARSSRPTIFNGGFLNDSSIDVKINRPSALPNSSSAERSGWGIMPARFPRRCECRQYCRASRRGWLPASLARPGAIRNTI